MDDFDAETAWQQKAVFCSLCSLNSQHLPRYRATEWSAYHIVLAAVHRTTNMHPPVPNYLKTPRYAKYSPFVSCRPSITITIPPPLPSSFAGRPASKDTA